jgi:cation:H+ antiporter
VNLIDLLEQYHLGVTFAVFAAGAAIIAIFGIRITHLARDLAVETGLGQAFMGAFFIGAVTSLSGITASATAAASGSASLAVSNSLGGIAAQTLFLVLADLLYRKTNLEFAAASIENMLMSAQLMILLGILLVAISMPGLSVLGVHPASFVLLLAYGYTLKLLVDAHDQPMWLPRMSRGTVTEEQQEKPGNPARRSRVALYLQFAVSALAVALSGWLLASAGVVIVERTGLSAGVVGGILIAVSTSLPELVIAVTAIRLGALTLAVGDIVGGNAFDTLFVAVADIFYRRGPIYADVVETEQLWLGCAMVMNAILLMGLLYRQKRGPANIGVESWAMLACYLGTVAYLLA